MYEGQFERNHVKQGLLADAGSLAAIAMTTIVGVLFLHLGIKRVLTTGAGQHPAKSIICAVYSLRARVNAIIGALPDGIKKLLADERLMLADIGLTFDFNQSKIECRPQELSHRGDMKLSAGRVP